MLGIGACNKKLSFSRALSSKERKINHDVCAKALEINGVKHHAIVMPAAANPAYIDKKDGIIVDTGVGSPYSQGAKLHLLFCKDLFAVNAVQELPLGSLSENTKSPYSGSSFSIGDHLIDPGYIKDLGLVNAQDIEKVNVPDANSSSKDDYWNNYDNCFEPKYQEFLATAYDNFKKLDSQHPLKKEFEQFKELPHIKVWLKPNARAVQMAKENGTWDFQDWPDIDKKLHVYLKHPDSSKYGEAQKRAQQLDAKSGQYQFTQFIAYRQREDMQKFANRNGINIIADSNIGWDNRDIISNPEAFLINFDKDKPEGPGKSTLACPMPYNPNLYDSHAPDKSYSVDSWGIYALNPDAKESVDYLKARYDNIAKYSDGVRIDAAWQYVTPFVKEEYENKKGSRWHEAGGKYFDAIASVLKKNNIDNNLVIAENIGSNENGRISKTNKFIEKYAYPIIRKVFEGASDVENVERKDWITLGVHDDETLVNQTKNNRDEQVSWFSRVFKGKNTDRPNKGSDKVQINFLDYFGRGERYNDCTDWTSPKLWSVRQPMDFERFYYNQVAEQDQNGNSKQAYGLNMPEALIKSFRDKGLLNKNNTAPQAKAAKKLLPLLQYFDRTLKAGGPNSPMTTAEADVAPEIQEQFDSFLKKNSK